MAALMLLLLLQQHTAVEYALDAWLVASNADASDCTWMEG